MTSEGLRESKDFCEKVMIPNQTCIVKTKLSRQDVQDCWVQDCHGNITDLVVKFDQNNLMSLRPAEDELDPATIETEGSQAFNVPNNETGLAFIEVIKIYLNKGRVRIRKRGRGSRATSTAMNSDIKIADSEWMAVYIDKIESKAEEDERHEQFIRERNFRDNDITKRMKNASIQVLTEMAVEKIKEDYKAELKRELAEEMRAKIMKEILEQSKIEIKTATITIGNTSFDIK